MKRLIGLLLSGVVMAVISGCGTSNDTVKLTELTDGYVITGADGVYPDAALAAAPGYNEIWKISFCSNVNLAWVHWRDGHTSDHWYTVNGAMLEFREDSPSIDINTLTGELEVGEIYDTVVDKQDPTHWTIADIKQEEYLCKVKVSK